MSANQQGLLSHVQTTNATGVGISTHMISFLDSVKDQPLGFRDLGLTFLEIVRILTALEAAMLKSLDTKQPFPEAAVPELERVIERTSKDFGELETLLGKFMKFEAGGIAGKLQKTWRMVFADKDVIRVGADLREAMGGLRMAMLLTNINPESVKMDGHYHLLEEKLQTQTPGAHPVADAPPPQIPPRPIPVPESAPILPPRREVPISAAAEATAVAGAATAAVLGHSSPPYPVDDLSKLAIAPEPAPTPEPTPEPTVEAAAEPIVEAVPDKKKVIIVDRSTLTFRQPTSTMGKGNASLGKALLAGIRGSKLTVVEQLLLRGVDPNGNEALDEYPIVAACDIDDPTILKTLLEFGADPDVNSKRIGRGILRVVCEWGRDAQLDLLLAWGGNPNRSQPDYTALPTAVHMIRPDYVEKMLTYGADVNGAGENGETSLIYACRHLDDNNPKTLEVLKVLVDWNVNVNQPSTCRDPALPILAAVIENSTPKVKFLLDHGADPKKELGIVEVATWRHNAGVINLLLDAGCPVNEFRIEKHLPVTTVLRDERENRVELLKLLLERGADPNLGGHDGQPLARAVYDVHLLKLLLAAGADPKKVPGLLEFAVYANNLESVQLLVEAGVSAEDSPHGHSPLSTAIRDDRRPIFDFLIKTAKADPNRETRENDWESRPLMWAIHCEHEDYIEPLLDAGADPSLCPAIMDKAVWRNCLKGLPILLARGGNVEEVAPNNVTPLHTATCHDRVEAMEILLAHGADPNHIANEHVLQPAVWDGKTHLIKRLLEAGADPKQCPGLPDLATWQGYPDVLEQIQLLLDHGADINSASASGHTALETCSRQNREQVMDFLLAKGADPNHKGNEMPLDTAVDHSLPTMVSKLLAAGADPNLCNGNPIAHAVWRDDLATVKVLVESGKADINAVHRDGHTPLTMASSYPRIEHLRYLLAQGADPNKAGWHLPITDAAHCYKTPEALEALLEAGADVDANDDDKETALVWAAWDGLVENFKMLVKHGAKVDLASAKGYLALDVAAERGHDEIVMFVLENME